MVESDHVLICVSLSLSCQRDRGDTVLLTTLSVASSPEPGTQLVLSTNVLGYWILKARQAGLRGFSHGTPAQGMFAR